MKRLSIVSLSVLVVATAFSLPRFLAESASARASSPAAKKVCKTVTKKAHGKKKRARVCRTARPKPRPAPTLPPTGHVVASIAVPGGSGRIVVAEGAVWVRREGEVLRIDPGTNGVTDTITVPGRDSLDVGDGSIWVFSPDDNVVSRLDLVTKQVVATIAVGALPDGIAVTPDAVWVANHHSGTVSRIDPSTNRVVATISVGPAAPGGPAPMVVSNGALWVRVFNIGEVVRIDPHTNKVVARIDLPGDGGSGADIAADAGGLWITENGAVVRIDPRSNRVVAQIDGNVNAFGAAVGLQSAWVSDQTRGVLRIDPQLNRITAEMQVPGYNDFFLTAGAGSVWASRDDRVYRIDPNQA